MQQNMSFIMFAQLHVGTHVFHNINQKNNSVLDKKSNAKLLFAQLLPINVYFIPYLLPNLSPSLPL